jgi:predicted rRNA methylase YqxC with S4 and FtsJ domains
LIALSFRFAKIVPPSIALLRPSGKIVALIKPQFEAGKAEADKGAGVIRAARSASTGFEGTGGVCGNGSVAAVD